MQCIGWSYLSTVVLIFQGDGLLEKEYQLPVAGKIKKHFNFGPKLNSTTAGVSVITVSTELYSTTQ